MQTTKKDTIPYSKLPHIRYFIIDNKSRSIHTHDAVELMLILENSVTIFESSKEYNLKAGDFFVVNSNALHGLECKSDRVLILTMQLSPNFASEYLPDLHNIRFVAPCIADNNEIEKQKLADYMKTAAQAYFRYKESDNFTCLAFTSLVLNQMLKLFSYTEFTGTEYLTQMHASQRMQRIIKYMNENIAEPRLLQKTAEHEGLSPTYLSRIFSDYFNTTFQQFLKQQRIEKAMQLLNSTKLPVYDICFECGFQDYRQLNKYCRENFGKTASECRGALATSNCESGDTGQVSNEFRYSDEQAMIYLTRTHVKERLDI